MNKTISYLHLMYNAYILLSINFRLIISNVVQDRAFRCFYYICLYTLKHIDIVYLHVSSSTYFLPPNIFD